MAFIARFKGRCSSCGEDIEPGENVFYDDHELVHVTCSWEQNPALKQTICKRCFLSVVALVDGLCPDCRED